jgi:hypothetical protein
MGMSSNGPASASTESKSELPLKLCRSSNAPAGLVNMTGYCPYFICARERAVQLAGGKGTKAYPRLLGMLLVVQANAFENRCARQWAQNLGLHVSGYHTASRS